MPYNLGKKNMFQTIDTRPIEKEMKHQIAQCVTRIKIDVFQKSYHDLTGWPLEK